MVTAPITNSDRFRVSLFAAVWFWLMLCAMPVLSAAPPEADPAVQEETDETSPGTKRRLIEPTVRSWIWQLFAMILGIIFSGTMLLLFVVMWGQRTRRLARKPLPSVAKPNELWFLKPKRPIADEKPAADATDEHEVQ
jgi:hypothetical protein